MRETLSPCAECGDEIQDLFDEPMACQGCGLCSDCCECDEPEWELRLRRGQAKLARQSRGVGPREVEDA